MLVLLILFLIVILLFLLLPGGGERARAGEGPARVRQDPRLGPDVSFSKVGGARLRAIAGVVSGGGDVGYGDADRRSRNSGPEFVWSAGVFLLSWQWSVVSCQLEDRCFLTTTDY
jgi:hypothetical protein